MNVILRCDGPLREAIRDQRLHTVDGAFACTLGTLYEKSGLPSHRKRRGFELTDSAGVTHHLFLKTYDVPEKASRKPGRPPAWIELDNHVLCARLGIAVADVVACGWEGQTEAQRSYIIFKAVPGEKMEGCFKAFLKRHGLESAMVETVTRQLADLLARLHEGGYVHRDMNLSHIFLAETDGRLELRVIDLARVFAPIPWWRFRWRIKDLAALKSSMPVSWRRRWWKRFLSDYVAGISVDGKECVLGGLCGLLRRGQRRRILRHRMAVWFRMFLMRVSGKPFVPPTLPESESR